MTRRLQVLLAACSAAAVLLPVSANAQVRRAPRVAARATILVGSPYYYRPFWYDPWYPSSYWYPAPYSYGGYFDGSASLRLQVTPRETEVYVDGYYAGVVDDFDGTFQRLHLQPGEHELQLYIPGYRLMTQRVYLQPHGTFRIRHAMEPLRPGDPEPVRPSGAAPSAAPDTSIQAPARPRPRGPASRGPLPRGGPAPASPGSEYGTVALRVQPGDAEVLIDGERWDGSGNGRLLVQLAPGSHRIEVRKDGYRTYTADVDIRAAETAPINVSLARTP